MGTRPTSARVREAIFNILKGRVDGCQVADCFAGSGALGLEALSHGAEHATFFESHRSALEVIERNIQELGLQASATVRRGKIPGSLSSSKLFDLVFMDPPWDKGWGQHALARLSELNLLRTGALVVLEERRGNIGSAEFVSLPWNVQDQRVYGDTELTMLTFTPPTAAV